MTRVNEYISINKQNKRAAFLLESGFCEREFLQAHSALSSIGIACRIISSDLNIKKSWNKNKGATPSSWGADYAVNATIKSAIPSDYDILVIVGGERSIDKLQLDKEVKPFISSFMQAKKPVIAYNSGINLLSYLELVNGYSLAAIGTICDIAKISGGVCSAPEFIVSKNLITLSRYRDKETKIMHAVKCILNGERYSDNIVSSDNMPYAHKVA